VLIEVVPAGSLFFDDFTRATDPSPLSPWIAAQGSWTITSGVLQAGSSGSYSDAYIPGGWSNITVQATIRFPATAWAAGLSARLNPATGARYVANIFPETTPETGSALHLRLMKFSDWTSYNSLTEVPLPGGNLGTSWHTLAMTLRGNEIIVYLDGAQVADVLDGSSPYTSGGIGAFQYNLGASFDNLGVWPAPPATLPEWYPVANGQTLSVAAPGVLANDSPSTGTSLTATLVTTASHGALILNPNGSFSYTPSGGFTGRDTFTYEAVPLPTPVP
jgi:hypothetical protein